MNNNKNNGNNNSSLSLLIKIIGVIIGLYLLFSAINGNFDNASYKAGYNKVYYNR